MKPEDIDLYEAEAVAKALYSYAYLARDADTEDLESAIRNAPNGRALIELLRALEIFGDMGHPDSTTLGCMIDQLTCTRRALEAQEKHDAAELVARLKLEDTAERLCALVESGIGAFDVDEMLEIHDMRMCVLDVRALLRGE